MSVSYECIPPTSEADVIKYGGFVADSSPPEHVHGRCVAAVVVRRGGGAARDGRATTEPNCCLPQANAVARSTGHPAFMNPRSLGSKPRLHCQLLHHSTVVEHPAFTGRRRVGSLPVANLGG